MSAMPSDDTRYLKHIHRTLRGFAIGAVLLLIGWTLQDILLLVFMAVLIACILRGASDYLHRRTGLGEGWALLAVVTGLLGAFAALIWWRGPAMADQASQVFHQLVTQTQRLWQQLADTDWGASLAGRFRQQFEPGGSGGVSGTALAGRVTGVVSSTFGLAGSVLLVIATALFLAISPQTYVAGTLRLLPPRFRSRGRDVLHGLGATLQLWFLGQLVDMIVVTILSGAGLYLLGVPLAGTLAVIAGLLNFVPYVGALAGAVPAVLVALAQSPTLALWVVLLFTAVQTLEGNLIAPLIQERTVSLPPALTILSQAILGTIFGLLGLVLATPVMAASLTAMRMIYVESYLERDED